MRKAISLLLLVLILAPAFADPGMAGRWRASSGFIVTIPEGTGRFNLLFDRPGDRVVHPARWVTPGQEFTWTDKQGATHRATLQSVKPVRIMDVNAAYPDSPAYWYRVE